VQYATAKAVAAAIKAALPNHVKAVHVMPKLHQGHLTIRVFMLPQIAEDPEPFIFTSEELSTDGQQAQ
jgi:hypothetical protein